MSRYVKLAMVTGLLLVSFLLTRLPAQTSEPKPLKVGVVNLSTVFEKYERRIALFEELQELQNQRNQEIGKLQQEIGALTNKLKMLGTTLAPDSPRWLEADKELMQKQAELKTLNNLATIEQERTISRSYRLIYREIRASIEAFAKAHKFDLILKTDNPELSASRPDFIPVEMSMKGILCHSPKLDITAEVLAALNSNFKEAAVN